MGVKTGPMFVKPSFTHALDAFFTPGGHVLTHF
jgi:hypothetical protein